MLGSHHTKEILYQEPDLSRHTGEVVPSIYVTREKPIKSNQSNVAPLQSCCSVATSGTLKLLFSSDEGCFPAFTYFSIHIMDILKKVVDRLHSAGAHHLNVFYFPSGLCAGRE